MLNETEPLKAIGNSMVPISLQSLIKRLDFDDEYPGGGYMTCGWTGSAARFSKRYPLLITESYRHTHFYDEFWRKTTHFLLFFTNFWITHPCLWKICRKRDPCLENLGPKNPPIWAAHTRTLNMLCTPPPGG